MAVYLSKMAATMVGPSSTLTNFLQEDISSSLSSVMRRSYCPSRFSIII